MIPLTFKSFHCIQSGFFGSKEPDSFSLHSRDILNFFNTFKTEIYFNHVIHYSSLFLMLQL
jgi:hypothetical protein